MVGGGTCSVYYFAWSRSAATAAVSVGTKPYAGLTQSGVRCRCFSLKNRTVVDMVTDRVCVCVCVSQERKNSVVIHGLLGVKP